MPLKAGIITQARMTSTRLPQKILMEVGNKPLLKYHTDRLKKSGLPIFIATTVNNTDNPVVEFAQNEALLFYRGSEENVLSRYYECAKTNHLDIVVRVTSDCPLIDGMLIKEAVEKYRELADENLYLSNCIKRTFPRGFDFEVFSFPMLEEAYKHARLALDIEHVTPYINQNKSGKVTFSHVLYTADKTDIRITVDTQDDFLLIKKLIEDYHVSDVGYKDIIAVFEQHPELKKMNAHIEQKKL
jgi:spore coat polysaccharide biosynthesis protein SpsF